MRRALGLLFGLTSACFYQPAGAGSTSGSSTTGAPSTTTTTTISTSTSTDATSSTSTSSTSTTSSTGTAGESTVGTSTNTTTSSTTTTTGDPGTTTGTTDATSSTSSGEPDPGTTTMTEPVCGNNLAELGETCDGTDLKGKECTDYPANYGGGDLACAATCKSYDFANCCKLGGQGCNNNGQCCSGSCVLFSCSI